MKIKNYNNGIVEINDVFDDLFIKELLNIFTIDNLEFDEYREYRDCLVIKEKIAHQYKQILIEKYKNVFDELNSKFFYKYLLSPPEFNSIDFTTFDFLKYLKGSNGCVDHTDSILDGKNNLRCFVVLLSLNDPKISYNFDFINFKLKIKKIL